MAAGVVKTTLLLVAGLSTLAFFTLSIWTFIQNGVLHPCPKKSSDPFQQHQNVTLPLLKVLFAALGSVVMEFYRGGRLASWLALASWHGQLGFQGNLLFICHESDADAAQELGSRVWLLSSLTNLWGVIGIFSTFCLISKLIYTRWRQLEMLSGGQRSEHWRRSWWGFLAYIFLLVSLNAAALAALLPFFVVLAVFLPLPAVLATRFVCLSWPNLRLATSARHAATHAGALPMRAQRIQQAAHSVLLQFVGTLAAGITTCLWGYLQWWALARGAEGHEDRLLMRTLDLAGLLDVFCNTLFFWASEGVLSGAVQSARLRSRTAQARLGRWKRSREAWQQQRSHTAQNGSDPQLNLQLQWDDKVRELAGRGVTLDAMLQFYRQTLPGVMPHFDPQTHTTGNVVFEAVIPYTSQRGCPAAEIMMAGERVQPQKMVTHNWNNKFSFLLAAIISDAIGESDFGMVSWLLIHDVDRLEAWIADRKVGSCTYWVCAFAVNQHVSICGGQCTCGRQKLLNDSPPVMPDGSSIPCEVNKFDDMIRCLSAESRTFEQLVAVDATCDVFWRAWCIAEISTAHEIGMSQTLKVISPDCLKAKVERLSQLKIEDMQATRQEDKDLILGRIQSPEDFNKTLQHVLLNEVIPAWSSLDASEQMSLAGCIIRWQRVFQEVKDPAMWADEI